MCRTSKAQNRIRPMLALLMAVLLATGCSTALSDPSQAPTLPSAAAIETELSTLPTRYPGEPLWTADFAGNVNASVDSTGSTVAILQSTTPGTIGLSVYDREGLDLWSYRFTQRQSGKVTALPGGERVVVALAGEDLLTAVDLFDDFGNLIWTAVAGAGTTVQGSPQGNAFALIDPGSSVVTVLSKDGEHLLETAVQGRASVQFVSAGELVLVEDEVQLTLLQLDGTVLWKYPLNRDLSRHVVMTADGKYIAVATGQSDSMIYLFNSSGKALWKHPLEFGGNNQLKFSQDDAYLAVYDVGTNAGVYLFDVAGGRLLWHARFKLAQNHRISAASLTFAEVVIVELLDTTQNLSGEDVTLHRLVGLNYDGRALWRNDQGRNVRLAISADATGLLVLERLSQGTEQALPQWHLSLFDMQSLLSPPETR